MDELPQLYTWNAEGTPQCQHLPLPLSIYPLLYVCVCVCVCARTCMHMCLLRLL